MTSAYYLGLAREIQEALDGSSPSDILDNRCGSIAFAKFLSFVHIRLKGRMPSFGSIFGVEIAERLFRSESAYPRLHQFAGQFLGAADAFIAPPFILECFLLVFPDEASGAHYKESTLGAYFGKLDFDDDGLLTGQNHDANFRKDGVEFSNKFAFYHRSLPGVRLSGGLVEQLLDLRATKECRAFGLALDRSCLFARDIFQDLNTRAHIRGPIRVDESILNSQSFPENHRGTVTVHVRTDPSPVDALFPLARIEVMWSRRGDLKTVQIEELLTADSVRGRRRETTEVVENRYLHAIWNGEHICHTDGAIRSYDMDSYDARLKTDLKKQYLKNSKYEKVFRLDTQLEFEKWVQIAISFFDKNELVPEYFQSEWV